MLKYWITLIHFKENGKFNKLDLVVSDAAPRASGIKSIDAAKLSNMIFSASKLAINVSCIQKKNYKH